MKTLLFVLFVLLLTGCSTVLPIAEDVCRIADDICFYQTQLCAMVNDTTYTRNQIDSLSTLIQTKQSHLQYAIERAR